MSRRDARTDRSSLDPVREVFEQFGREDPMYAALSRQGLADNRWDPEEFFATGRLEILDVLDYADSLGLNRNGNRALDFGCAVGRLTQALAGHFDEVIGVDIAAAMVERARDFNRHGERVCYLVNTSPDLQLFDGDSFDFVYSNKVLQHIPPEYQMTYVQEFVRVLRPGGMAIFQLRNGPRIPPGSPRAWLYTLNRRYVRRLLQRIRGRRPYEMHYLARSRVEELVEAAGGRIVDVVDLSLGRPDKSLRFCIEKPERARSTASASLPQEGR